MARACCILLMLFSIHNVHVHVNTYINYKNKHVNPSKHGVTCIVTGLNLVFKLLPTE